MALDMQPGAGVERLDEGGRDRATAPADAPTGPVATAPSPVVLATYERAVRVAVLLVGDHALAADVVADAVTTIRTAQRATALRSAADADLMRALVLQAQEVDERLTRGEPTDPPPVARAAHTDGDPFDGINHRDVRWALLSLPMRERAALVLHARVQLDQTVLERVLALTVGDAPAITHDARVRLLGALQLEAADGQVDEAVARAGDDLIVSVRPDDVAEALQRERGWRERFGRSQLVRVAVAATLLAGALVWLTTRDTRPAHTVVTPPPANLRRTTTTAARAPTSVATTTSTTTASRGAARGALGSITTDGAPPTTAPSDAGAPTTAESVAPGAATDDVQVEAAVVTAAPPAEPAPATTAPPATTAAPPPATVAPFANLSIAGASCTRSLFDVSFTVTGVTDVTNAQVQLATPWGTYGAAGTAAPGSNVATWGVAVKAGVRFPGPGPYTLTARAGSQQSTRTITCA